MTDNEKMANLVLALESGICALDHLMREGLTDEVLTELGLARGYMSYARELSTKGA
ncbi:MAG: hypothetical protein OJF50_002472 [Nitrospira sp.]|jgi:hypothetical protein|nr:hypothetical protein [Nitrospira sp.]